MFTQSLMEEDSIMESCQYLESEYCAIEESKVKQ